MGCWEWQHKPLWTHLYPSPVLSQNRGRMRSQPQTPAQGGAVGVGRGSKVTWTPVTVKATWVEGREGPLCSPRYPNTEQRGMSLGLECAILRSQA